MGPIADANIFGNVGMAKQLDWFGELALILDVSTTGTADSWTVKVMGLIDYPNDDENETTIESIQLKSFVIDGQQKEQVLFDNACCTDIWIEIARTGSTDTLVITNVLVARVMHPLGSRR